MWMMKQRKAAGDGRFESAMTCEYGFICMGDNTWEKQRR